MTENIDKLDSITIWNINIFSYINSMEGSFCFVVEDKPGLMEEYGDNPRKMNNGVTLVKPRETAWPKAFFESKKTKEKQRK